MGNTSSGLSHVYRISQTTFTRFIDTGSGIQEQSQGWSTRQEQEPQYRRFAADPAHDMFDIKAAEELGTLESRYFIIV
jgi:hypothetical protein